MNDLCHLMEYGDGSLEGGNGYDYDDYDRPGMSSRELGTALTFAEMMAEEDLSEMLESLDESDPDEILEALELERAQKVQRVSLKSRKQDVPAFEQYVYAKCGISK